MTSEDLRIKAQILTGFTINATTNFSWVKSAISFIAINYPNACPSKTVDVTVEDGGTYSITDNLVRIDRVTKGDYDRPLGSESYRVDPNGNFVFYNEGTYHITYKYEPEMPQTSSTAISMADRYVEPIKYYIAARMRARIYGAGDSDATTYDSLFQNYIENADIVTQRANRRFRRLPVRI